MRTEVLEWKPFFDGRIVPKENFKPVKLYAAGIATAAAVAATGGQGLGIAAALEPFKLIVAEVSDPVCFVGGAIGLYKVAMGDREEGFKQIFNAAIAQLGFFVWPKIQIAIRAGLG